MNAGSARTHPARAGSVEGMSTSSESTSSTGFLQGALKDWRKALVLGVLTIATLGLALVALHFVGVLLRMLGSLLLGVAVVAAIALGVRRLTGRSRGASGREIDPAG